MKKLTARSAFTLIELLVVIAIIGILASILLPVLANAKKKANIVKSAQNLRSIGQGLEMYLGDNEQWYPRIAGPAGLGGKVGMAVAQSPTGLKPLPDIVSSLYGAKVPYDERPLNRYITNVKSFHDPSDTGGGAYSVPSCFESFGTSYQPQVADDMFRVKRVFGERRESEDVYEGQSLHEQEISTAGDVTKKIIMGDWNWPYDREDSWHGAGQARHIMLFADGHVESDFIFPPTSTMTNWFLSPPPDPNYRWW